MLRILRGAGKSAVQEGSETCAFFRKRVATIGSGFRLEYFKFRSRLTESVKKTVRTLLVNALLITFAHLVQWIFWIIVGIGAYGVGLTLTQPDGYERVATLAEASF